MHLDGQPVVDREWAQPSPWKPVVKKKDPSGNWQIVNTDFLFQQKLDPELRVFARASSDDKAPIMMFLAAFDGLREARLDPAINVKVLLDSEEEKGSPSIPSVVSSNKDLLKTDAIVIHDGPRHQSERPTLIFGNRGATRVTLTVFGPKQPLHSGHFGNYVPNPAMRLARLLASMKDDDGRVTVPGYYDRIKLTDAEKKILADTGDDEAAIRKRTGIKTAELVGGNLQEAIQYPSLNVRGMAAASVGDKASNIIPHQAIAEFDLRTTPEAPPEYLFGLLKVHIEKQGYHLVAGPPTDDAASERYVAALATSIGQLLFAFAAIHFVVLVAVNPLRADRVPDRFPTIVQDVIVFTVFALVATLVLQEKFLTTSAVGAVVAGFVGIPTVKDTLLLQ
jgi:acetylornithine deacetylase/succinyl-diaminopimelate desuccinylase-like protein